MCPTNLYSFVLSLCVYQVAPAVSFAWEPAEANVMDRPPRNMATDRLVRPALLIYSYLQAGIVEAGACILAYLLVFTTHGVPLSSLPRWATDVDHKPDVMLPSGKVMTYDDQVSLAWMAATAYYVTLVLSQAVHVFVTKTRFMPMLQHGLGQNHVMVYGVLVELGVMFFITYSPGIHQAFETYPELPSIFFTPFLISAVVLVVWGEIRKYIIRSTQTGQKAWVRGVLAW